MRSPATKNGAFGMAEILETPLNPESVAISLQVMNTAPNLYG
jgi:hypothetical protein